MVRAKFRVNGIFGGTIDGAESKRIEMSPVFASEAGREGNACEENAIFGKYTPAGNISITIVNPSASEQFEVNKEYYVDFSSVEECQDKAEEVEEKEEVEEQEDAQDEEVKTEGETTGEEKSPETETVGEAAAGEASEDLKGEESTEGQPEGQVATEGQESNETTGDQTIAEGEATGEANPAQSVE